MNATLRKPLVRSGSEFIVRLSAREVERLGLAAGELVDVVPAGPASVDWEALPLRRQLSS